jgi:predicted nucleic-acid-binding protein
MVMVAADTNVWARAYLNDDAAQAKIARSALAKARSEGGVFVPLIVLAELSWVLRGSWDRERVLHAIKSLTQTRGVVIESPELASRALEASRNGSVGFADHLISQISFNSGADEIITFDKGFGKIPRVRFLK